MFANPQVIADVKGSAPSLNVNATTEGGEPTTTEGFQGGRSVWFRWVAPASGSLTFNLTADFDSQLAIYTGTTVNALTSHGEDDVGGNGGDTVTISTIEGIPYLVRVAGYQLASGRFTLIWSGNPVYEKVFSFSEARAADGPVTGIWPSSSVVQGIDGNFYGITERGGASDEGTVFKMTPSGLRTTLVEFTGLSGTSSGSLPNALVQGRDGDFYGTTSLGGENDEGTVFKMSPKGVMTTLVEFTGSSGTNEGSFPAAGLVQAVDGSFYGTTLLGGATYDGTVFKMTPSGILTTLAEFTGISGTTRGSGPNELVIGSDGNIYGTAIGGGAHDSGTVFRISPSGTLTTLVEFTGATGAAKGRGPHALMQATDGNFYGITSGDFENDHGTVFRVTPGGVMTTLLEFTGTNGRGPEGILEGPEGNFYGTTEYGGSFFDGGSYSGDGTAFKMTSTGALTTLVEFGGINGIRPNALIRGSDGNFYGTTFEGGVSGNGTFFKITSTGVLTTRQVFTSVSGSAPSGALVQGSDRNFYGMTERGGAGNNGIIFKMTSSGVLTPLVEFTDNGATNKGRGPEGGLVVGSDDNFYGITRNGGASGNGTAFRMTSTGVLTTLVEFTDVGTTNRGRIPLAGLVQSTDGNFYGTTAAGGTGDNGTVFRMTPTGMLTTLVEFTGDGTINKGRRPLARLVKGLDGNFYGTTEEGGADDQGTIFSVTSGGLLTTLVEFTGRSGPARGSEPNALMLDSSGNFYGTTVRGGINGDGTIFKMTPTGELATLVDFSDTDNPKAGLVRAFDGNFYGTTLLGGPAGYGTVFKMTSAGVLTTLHDFVGDGADSRPSAPLIPGFDGNLYGTTSGYSVEGGSAYRMVFPGVPNIFPLPPEGLTTTTAVLQCKVNPRGGATTVSLEYGNDGASFPNQIAVSLSVIGYRSLLFGRTLSDLEPGTTYFYRFKARSGIGETVSPVQSVSTLVEPVAAANPANPIAPTSARLNGSVNAHNYAATVVFEWGTDGNSFPNSVPAAPPIVIGNTNVAVSAAVAGLTPGQTYYYRVVASNLGGTAVSGQESFRTLTAPIAALTGASPVSTTRTLVEGTVDANGSQVTVRFEYGTNGVTFPNSEAASPEVVSGEGLVPVSATLRGLIQGTTYRYRISATGPGGTGVSETGTFTLSILSGLIQNFPDPPPFSTGTTTVHFDPPDKGAWRFAGEKLWRTNGMSATHLASGERLMEFLPVPGFIRPLEELVDVVSGENQVLERSYFETPVSGSGSLAVFLKPATVASQAIPEEQRAQWRLSGEPWRDSGVTRTNLPAGTYLIECKSVDGRVTPPAASITIGEGGQRQLTLTYFRENEPIGARPLPLTFSQVSADEDLPFAYVGQIRSDVGLSTGFVVKRRVVATAGHVVFDDGSLSYITRLQWLFQRHASEHEPKPQVPRGYYLAAGYAAARTNAVPGEGTPQSQTLDYAALYFLEEAGRGGFGGFLASESMDENEFLDSRADKILAGYAIDGIRDADQGKLHATPMFTDALLPAFGETWTTMAVHGVGGCSGGPLFVRHVNGSFYPAAIYLGGSAQTVVRAIDRDVIELFDRAETSANGGGNNTSGGITHTEVTTFGSPTEPGSLAVIIEPEAARTNGGRWQLLPNQTFRPSGSQRAGLTPGTYTLDFTTIAGFPVPPKTNIVVEGGSLKTVTFTYGSIELDEWRMTHFGTSANTGAAADRADPDGDRSVNMDEFVAGTNPNDRSDSLKILSIMREGTACRLVVAGKEGRIYELQRFTFASFQGTNGVWSTNASVGPLSGDAPLLLTDPVNHAGKAFYRVRVTRP